MREVGALTDPLLVAEVRGDKASPALVAEVEELRSSVEEVAEEAEDWEEG